MMNRFSCSIAAGAITLMAQATALGAQGYNTFVITIPYDISLPAEYVSVEIYCGISVETQNPLLITAGYSDLYFDRIRLTNGKASGELKFGYDTLGNESGFFNLDENDDALKVAVSDPDFQVNVECDIDEVETLQDTYEIEKDGGTYTIEDSGTPILFLDSVPNGPEIDVEIDADDNTATRPITGQMTTPQFGSDGLSGLQSILESQ